MNYPKRLIEVDLPIARISAHARREKSIRHGHISTLHIWWARRPLAACRAVICAALWPDPADEHCPTAFREAAIAALCGFAKRVFPDRVNQVGHDLQQHVSQESWGRWEALAAGTLTFDAAQPADMPILRMALLDFIADFANWDNSTASAYLETSRSITQAAHVALGGEPGTRPLVVDPFAGGGSIPLEALRVGADAFASDLNPVAVLLNKVVLEYIPTFGNSKITMQGPAGNNVTFQGLADAVRYWGKWVKEQAEKELAEFYPKDPNGSTPIAYLWARTILSEAPGEADIPIEVPLIRSLWLCKKPNRKVALRWVRGENGAVQTELVEVTHADGVTRKVRRPLLEIFEPKWDSEVEGGTVARGSATCPVTGYTTKVASVRNQLRKRSGGSRDGRIYAVITLHPRETGRHQRIPTIADVAAVENAATRWHQRFAGGDFELKEQFSGTEPRRIPLPLYGIKGFADMFNPRQLMAVSTIARLVRDLPLAKINTPDSPAVALRVLLALCLDKVADLCNMCCRWEPIAECPRQLFARQAIPMVWDPAEGVPIGESSGSFSVMVERLANVLEGIRCSWTATIPQEASATNHPLPDDSVNAFITDPPYYFSVPYSDLSDFFYVWLKRSIGPHLGELFARDTTPKSEECVQNLPHAEVRSIQKIAPSMRMR